MRNAGSHRICTFRISGIQAIGSTLLSLIVPMAAASDASPVTDEAILALIVKLGDPEYLTRDRAQNELKRLGLEAFDAIFEATMHEDIEVARRARYLLRSNPIRWQTDTDPPAVKEVLRAYSPGSAIDRRSFMDRLARLPNGQGIDALCRLARFETDHALAKHAALLVMSSLGNHADPPAELSSQIRQAVGKSRRVSCAWLREYANTLDSPLEKLASWDRILREEQTVYSQHPERTDQRVLRDFMRWYSDLLQQFNKKSESVEVIRRSFDVMRGEPEDLIDMSNWLLSRELWRLVEELAQRHSNRFDDSLELLYILAESQMRQGKTELSEITADHARSLEATPYAHIRQAQDLYERGLSSWCEKEYRRVFELTPKGDDADLQARSGLSELLHDQERHLAAGEVWKDLFDALEKDKALAEQLGKNRTGIDLKPIKSRMFYYIALHFRDQSDRAMERANLELAIREFPGELDVLIAMHRFRAADAAWTKKTADLIKATSGRLNDSIVNQEKFLEQNPFDGQTDTRSSLARFCNEYAWLISNTEGDFELAVKRSHRSLQLSPGQGAYLDTLGRCYYAVGQYDNAIKYQRQALNAEPHSAQMRRQLELFIAAQNGSTK